MTAATNVPAPTFGATGFQAPAVSGTIPAGGTTHACPVVYTVSAWVGE